MTSAVLDEPPLSPSPLDIEIASIRQQEIPLVPLPGPSGGPPELVLVSNLQHDLSLLSVGTMSIYEHTARVTGTLPGRVVRFESIDFSRRWTCASPLRSIEYPHHPREALVLAIGITAASELPDVLRWLRLLEIPIDRRERTDDDPLIVVGGPGAGNPFVLERCADYVIPGPAEVPVVELLTKRRSTKRFETLDFVPRGAYSTHAGRFEPAPVQDLRSATLARAPISDGARTIVVPTFGCRQNCHFCHLGIEPLASAPLADLKEHLEVAVRAGAREVIVSSASLPQYGEWPELLRFLAQLRDEHSVSVVLGSFRADEADEGFYRGVAALQGANHLLPVLRGAGQETLITLAPETGSDDLLRLMGKSQMTKDYFASLERALESVRPNVVMLYLMLGFGPEEEADIRATADLVVASVRRAQETCGARILCKFQQFIPRMGTAGQLMRMPLPSDVKVVERGLVDDIVARCVAEGLPVPGFDLFDESYITLEAILCRGGAELHGFVEALADGALDAGDTDAGSVAALLERCGIDFRGLLARREPSPAWDLVYPAARNRSLSLMSRLERDRGESCC